MHKLLLSLSTVLLMLALPVQAGSIQLCDALGVEPIQTVYAPDLVGGYSSTVAPSYKVTDSALPQGETLARLEPERPSNDGLVVKPESVITAVALPYEVGWRNS